MPFDLATSKLQEEKLHAWRSKPLTGRLIEVPAIGEATIKTLSENGIYNTFQLIGDMLKHVDEPFEDEAAIKRFGRKYWDRMVHSFNSPAGHAHTVVHALIEKVSCGFKVPGVEIPKSRISDADMLEWKQQFPKDSEGKYILDRDIQCFKYVGPTLARSFATNDVDNIQNSWQFIGLFLEHYTGNPKADLEAYRTKISSYGKGVQSEAYAAQILELLSVGIAVKKVVQPIPMAAFDEVDEAPGAYVRPAAARPASGSALRKNASPVTSTKAKNPQPQGMQSTIVMAIALLVLLLFIKNKLGL